MANNMEFKKKFQTLEKVLDDAGYLIKQRKQVIGETIFATSLILMFFSLHVMVNTNAALDEFEEFESELTYLDVVTGSEEFNQSLEALESIEGTQTGQRHRETVQTFRSIQSSTNSIQEAQSQLEGFYGVYQWLFLLSILGMVGGITVIYL